MRQFDYAAATIAALLSAPIAGHAVLVDQRLPVNAPQCAFGQFAPGIVTPEGYDGAGPTDVNAETANGRLAVGLNRRGTITVFRWPRPSHYNQIKYFTLDRSKPYFGAYPNEGAFLGVVVADPIRRTIWLRDLPAFVQSYASPTEDRVVTTFTDSARGIVATLESLVDWDHDVFAEQITVSAPQASRPQALVSFENLNLVVSKLPGLPGQDWCLAEQNVDAARYDRQADAIIHEKVAVDVSTIKPSSVAVAMGFGRASSGHQVGGDAYEPTAGPAGLAGPTLDAYQDAADGSLTGNDGYAGQTTGALETPLAFDAQSGIAAGEVYFAAAANADDALSALADARERGFPTMASAKSSALHDLLQTAPLPSTTDQKIVDLAERALVVDLTTASPEGPIVAAITNQPPYAEDWLRDGSFINHAMDVAGFHHFVTRHNLFYASVQATLLEQPSGSLGVPPGNWSMNYYNDGVNGGPIPWEIDETGFGAWTLWDHYTFTCDRDYLSQVYPAIRRAADFLVACRDPQSGVQCRGTEDDNFAIGQQQTIHGAATTWLALASARDAANVLGFTADALRYQARLDDLGPAIDASLWDDANRNYGGTYDFGSWIIWPARFHVDPGDPLHARILDHASYLWNGLADAFRAPDPSGPPNARYEGKGLLSLAELTHSDPAAGYLDRVKQGLHWIAYTEATPDTGLLGETWFVDTQTQTVITNTGIPHLWEHSLFYLTALSAYGTPIYPPACPSSSP